ncbi:MAG TPA: M56 family metallopeptidase, partial [Chitinophagaceae bacterium]|nr:M56 family metallopeptidase [Chitinophagaceae bacterium]
MTALSHSNFLQALGWAVLNSLWQLALLWVVYQLITAVFKINKPAQKSSLSILFLYAGFAWFIFTFISIAADKSAAISSDYIGLMNIDGNQAVNNWLHTALPIASLLYLLLLVLPALNFIRNFRYVQVIRRYGISKADVKWRMFVQKVGSHMGINKPVQVWMSELITSPVTIGYLKPVILLPLAAMNHLSVEQTEAVLLHELSHIRRFDYLTNLITRIIQTILYFNPFVKAFTNIIEREREKSCDEMVIQFQYEPHGYASALLALEKVSGLTRQSLTVPVSGNKRNELLNRVESILGIQKKKGIPFNRIAGVLAGILCLIAFNALLLLGKPAGKANAAPGLFTELTSPLLFSPGAEAGNVPEIVSTPEIKSNTIINHPTEDKTVAQPAGTAANPERQYVPVTDKLASNGSPASPFVNVNFVQNMLPVLNAKEEAQIHAAVAASRQVLAEGAWKVVEDKIADAMTSAEKNEVKIAYKKAISKTNLNKIEANLRLA